MRVSRRSCLKALATMALSARLPLPVALAQPQERQLPRFFAPTPTGVPRAKPLPIRFARTQILFETPKGYPNALSSVDEGLWVADQGDDDQPSIVWLLDDRGKL